MKKKKVAKRYVNSLKKGNKTRKFEEVLLYILDKVGSKVNIGEAVIYKLLYFIDFDYYEKFEEKLVGATYVKDDYGPTPVEFNKIVKSMLDKKDIVKVADEYFQYPQTKYLPLRKPDLGVLDANEKAVIDEVLNRLSDMDDLQISDYSHEDVPWQTTEEGQEINYRAVFYRTPAYSRRNYIDDENMPIGKMTRVKDFLPPPEKLKLPKKGKA